MAKEINIDVLRQVVKNSHDFTDVCIALGYKRSTNTTKRIKKICISENIKWDHFDMFYKQKQKRKNPAPQQVECPVCKKIFQQKWFNSGKWQSYCSKKCCNQLKLGNRFSEETNRKTSESLKKFFNSELEVAERKARQTTKEKLQEIGSIEISQKRTKCKIIIGEIKRVRIRRLPIEVQCANCGKTILKKGKPKGKNSFCSNKCATTYLWKDSEYRERIISRIKQRIADGNHKGWTTRNKLSYPEKFFKHVLNRNGFEGKFITNHPVPKKDLGIKCSSCYFLDFYFPDLKLDLEIDGKQHQYTDRIASDKIRDKALTKNGYIVYRIKWKNINKKEGKEYIRSEIKKFLEFINTRVR